MNNIIQLVYLITATLLIMGLKNMSSPKTAKQGIIIAGMSMLVAIAITFFVPNIVDVNNYSLIIAAIVIGGLLAWYSATKVKMIQIPQMIALYNAMGGGAAAAIAAIELLRSTAVPLSLRILAVLGAIIGTLSFSGSLIAFAKLQEWLTRTILLPFHNTINILLAIAIIYLGTVIVMFGVTPLLLILFFLSILVLGITFTLPIGGANMPVVISLFNAMTGLAVAFNGFVLNNFALIIAGIVVGASGTLLTQLMAKAMHKSLTDIVFITKTDSQGAETTVSGSLKPMDITDAAVLLNYANKVIITPGYGMAVAQAQFKIAELVNLLEKRNIPVKFAIHPVAGRMPGHMNVLLAEAGVSYDKIFDLEEINSDFANTDVAIVIGANDIVNPAARENSNSPIYGMPILDVDAAKNVLVIKRGQGKGFSNIENSLFTKDNTSMLYGDAQEVVNNLVQAIKTS